MSCLTGGIKPIAHIIQIYPVQISNIADMNKRQNSLAENSRNYCMVEQAELDGNQWETWEPSGKPRRIDKGTYYSNVKSREAGGNQVAMGELIEIIQRLGISNTNCHLVGKLGKEQLECYKNAFAMFDKNNDGKIRTSELLSLMRSLGENPTEDDIQNIINETDLNKDGMIDFTEFLCKIVERQAIYSSTEDLRLAFSYFDNNGDGKVNVREIRDIILVIANVISVEVEELVRELCKTPDLFIDYEELLLMIKAFEIREQLKRDVFDESLC